jgi:hypothetical protein
MGRQAPSGDRKFMRQIEKHMKARRSRVELCIDLFVAETGYVPDEARPVRDASGSPGAFPEQPTLMLTFRDHDARVAAAGVWRRTAAGRWKLQPGLASSLMSGTVH